MAEQTRFFLLSLAMGFLIGLLYDGFRILRAAAPHPGFLVQLEDVLYWIVASFGTFYFVLNVNDGEVRAYTVAAAAAGMIAYFLTLSPLVMRVSVAVITFLKKAVVAAVAALLFPIRLLWKLLAVPLAFFGRAMYGAAKPVKECLQKAGRYATIRRARFTRSLRVIFKKI